MTKIKTETQQQIALNRAHYYLLKTKEIISEYSGTGMWADPQIKETLFDEMYEMMSTLYGAELSISPAMEDKEQMDTDIANIVSSRFNELNELRV